MVSEHLCHTVCCHIKAVDSAFGERTLFAQMWSIKPFLWCISLSVLYALLCCISCCGHCLCAKENRCPQAEFKEKKKKNNSFVMGHHSKKNFIFLEKTMYNYTCGILGCDSGLECYASLRNIHLRWMAG